MAKGKVTFDQDLCKGCALCVSACPVKIVEIDKATINKKGYNPASVSDMDKCVGCANCATMCPDAVITVERD
ncbi:MULTISPECIES: 4Fe-4S binding protein [Paraclostridium]|jgi:2-oxoglutarate ferredoxin oxidoreductase subunit delta|uniref:2-oxoacid:acceptor oxidoreductase n=3 Tax=Paraclostridium TaxID=1849822 RepID=A0A0M3DKR6_9FIRM|nr:MULTISPECIES: 4Fe-4S binding protein [Paraclostridium]KGJ48828.1 2-oxoacid:acceptor oxidoreductase [Clostridium sp. NCR]MCU9809433.1 4Fe-4S binding protein [Paraclostridium sp. AKS46]MDV8113697.1 4Fe-4S binding protein [Bacillus sp. BAU-SS-2023]RDC51076.1 4Fe-4S dicluster domain-containing protein [Acinetobacter sp. RIT592]EQK45454.1 4Fe-4S binding domain protein [[Clostridium] bifermentans ATCC 638] [Paraclostridium bifermentans ATCC 638 = DSM 14991]